MPRFSAKSDLRAIVPCKSNKRLAFKQIRRTGVDTASEVHAGTRLRSGFSIDQLVAEYRALRASVMLLWSRQPDRNPEFREQDALRFNEAIDKGLAESVSRYSQAVNESQDVFLGVLGHDLRSPLAVILLSAEFFLNADELGSRYAKIAASVYSRRAPRREDCREPARLRACTCW